MKIEQQHEGNAANIETHVPVLRSDSANAQGPSWPSTRFTCSLTVCALSIDCNPPAQKQQRQCTPFSPIYEGGNLSAA